MSQGEVRQIPRMRRVLIVTSSFPPAMAADMHRARMLSYDLPALGWEVDLLTPGLEFQRPDAIDPDGATLSPENVNVHQVAPRFDWIFRLLNMRSMAWRSLIPLFKKGSQLLQRNRYELVYITTTQFNSFCLGRIWRAKFGVPYVLDIHDPWYQPNPKYVTTKKGLKTKISSALSKHMEGYALSRAVGLVSVSPLYIEDLRSRYERHPLPCLREGGCSVIPFGATRRDFEVLADCKPGERAERKEANLEIRYVGAGGSIMEQSLRRLFRVVNRLQASDRSQIAPIHFHFHGTDSGWKEGEPRFIEKIAREEGVSEWISESPSRIPYLRSIQLISSADGVLVLGVDDPAYMPSKLFTYALSGKPLLASLHRDSVANRYFDEVPDLGHLILFHPEGGEDDLDNHCSVVATYFKEIQSRRTIDRNGQLEPHLAPAMARKHAELFQEILEHGSGPS